LCALECFFNEKKEFGLNIDSISVNEIAKESQKSSISEKAIGPEPDSTSLINEVLHFIFVARSSSVNPNFFLFSINRDLRA